MAAAIELVTKDEKLALFLLSNPIKNTTMQLMFVKCGHHRIPWMIVDGAFNRE